MINSKVFKLKKKKDLQNFSLKISADDLFLSDGFVDHDILYCLVEPFHLELLLGFCLHKPETPEKKNTQKLNFFASKPEECSFDLHQQNVEIYRIMCKFQIWQMHNFYVYFQIQ